MKSTLQQCEEVRFEIEALAIRLAEMLGVALHYAGVPEEKMPDAVDAYLNGIEEAFNKEPDRELGYEEIIQVIEHMRKKHPTLFTK